MTTPQPGWYSDPARTFDLRWWDGARWTDGVVSAGVVSTSPLPDPRREAQAGAVREQVRAGGTLFTEAVLVLDGPRADGSAAQDGASVQDGSGRPLGTVVEVGGGRLRRLAGRAGRLLPYRLEVRDASGVPQLLLVRPAALGRVRVLVERPGVGEIGQLVREDQPGAVRYALVSGGRTVGSLTPGDGPADEARVVDDAGAEVASVRRSGDGGPRTLQVHRPLQDPLLSLVVAGAVGVDTALAS